jgi:dTDP-4-amino-4,6-dideoxygalactose transaminase
MKFLAPIFISLSPNAEKDDIFLALKLLFQPWRGKIVSVNQRLNQRKSAVQELEEEFKKYLGVKYAFSFNSGRSALMAILNLLSLNKGDEVLLQTFTCNAAVNPILALGFKPVFVDVEKETLNIDPEDLKKKIGPKSKVVMVQHTFGLPVKIDGILDICQKNNLILIEDCAHSLGAKYQGKLCGTFGKAAFFSFGRDKIISSVYGGMAITNDSILSEKLRNFQEKCSQPSYFWIFQQLLHPVLTEYLIKPFYHFFGVGKWLLIFFQKTKILSKAVTKAEKEGRLPTNFPKKLPTALNILALNQLKKLEIFNQHRNQIAKIYEEELRGFKVQLPLSQEGRIYMRYSLILEGKDTDKILRALAKKGIYLDDGWRKTPIVPPDTNQEKMGYQKGSCPRAEKIAKNILNLPTHINISQKDAQKIVTCLSQC